MISVVGQSKVHQVHLKFSFELFPLLEFIFHCNLLHHFSPVEDFFIWHFLVTLFKMFKRQSVNIDIWCDTLCIIKPVKKRCHEMGVAMNQNNLLLNPLLHLKKIIFRN